MRDEVAACPSKAVRQDLDVRKHTCRMTRHVKRETVGLETIVKAIEFIYEPSAIIRQPATDLFETRTTAMRAECNYDLLETRNDAAVSDSCDVIGIWAVAFNNIAARKEILALLIFYSL